MFSQIGIGSQFIFTFQAARCNFKSKKYKPSMSYEEILLELKKEDEKKSILGLGLSIIKTKSTVDNQFWSKSLQEMIN